MSKDTNKLLLEVEDQVDDKCVNHIIHQGAVEAGDKYKIIDNGVYCGKKHILSIMKRHCTPEEVVAYRSVVLTGFQAPVRELLQLKQYYKLQARKSVRWTWFWALSCITSLGAIGYLLYQS